MQFIPKLMIRSVLFSLFFFLSFTTLYSQQQNVMLKIFNQKKQPVSFATVTVINQTDSSKILQQVADTNGYASFQLYKGEQYLVRITSIGYESFEKGVLIKSSQNVFSFTLEPAGRSLTGVTVVSKKPLMRQEDDKTIVDPENLVNSSTSAYEILEKTPGLFVDQDGNIYLNSTTPATIYINGREMKMSTADIATMLKNLPPNSIASIEILRTPSAKYDASGGGGIVNVVLKKGVKLGFTGSVNTGINQGVYGNRFIGVNLNNNVGAITSYLNVSFSSRDNYERIKTNRIYSADTLLSQDAITKYPGTSYHAGFGVGYEFNKKWQLNYDGRAIGNYFDNNTKNFSVIEKQSTGEIITENLSAVKNKGDGFFTSHELTSKFKWDTVGSEWTSGIYYSTFKNNSTQEYDVSGTPVSKGDGIIDNGRDFISFQSDLKWKLKRKLTMETGVKAAFLEFNNGTQYYKETNGTRAKDPFRTNTYRYDENINAFYLQGSKSFGEFILKLGARLENTNMDGHQIVPYDTSFKLHRTDLFPYVYLSRKVMTIAGYELRGYLVFRRTISRPAYENLNPFPRYVDQYLFETGNPTLRPQFTRNYEANISVDDRPLLAIGVNDTKDIFTNVIYQADSSRSIAYRTYDNLGKNKEIYFRGMGAIPPGKRYFFVIGAQYNHNFYQGRYENKPLAFKKGSWTFFTYQYFKIDGRSQITVNGFMRVNGQLQFYELSTFGALNSNINRQFFNQKLTLTLSVNDIFLTNKNEFTISQGSVSANGFREADTRRYGISLRYNFGIRKKEENNIFNLDSPEKTN